jgi:hypothetical protein
MHILEMVLTAFAKAQTLKVIRNESGVWLSNGDGFPLNLSTGQIERIERDADPPLRPNGWL